MTVPPTALAPGAAGRSDAGRPIVRSPVHVLRALIGGGVLAGGIVALLVFENGLLGVGRDLATVQDGWPTWSVRSIQVGLGMLIAAAILVVNGTLLIRRRYRRWAMVNAAALAAILLGALASHAVLALAPSDALADAVDDAASSGLGNDTFAASVGVLTLASVWLGRRLRPWAVAFVAVGVVLAVIDGSVSIITLPFDVGVGMVAGALVALAFGIRDRTPSPTDLSSAMARSGFDTTRVDRAGVDARGSVPWYVVTRSGDALFVKTLAAEERAADLLFRLYRVLRLRRAGDHRPFSSLRRAVEHEALLSLAAEARGIRTPGLVTVAEIGTDGMLIAYRRLAGRSLDASAADELDDALLVDLWRLVASLRDAAIAHRDLRLANVFRADDGSPWIIDFGFAELAADDALLDRDIVELLASTSAVVGAQRTVAAALRVLGHETVGRALPWIQPLALSSATRDAIGGAGGCTELRAQAAAAVGVDDVEPARLERLRWLALVQLQRASGS
jgi:undecaprenyl-diphosphatase